MVFFFPPTKYRTIHISARQNIDYPVASFSPITLEPTNTLLPLLNFFLLAPPSLQEIRGWLPYPSFLKETLYSIHGTHVRHNHGMHISRFHFWSKRIAYVLGETLRQGHEEHN